MDQRDRLLMAVAIKEWIEQEQTKPSVHQRASDCEDLRTLAEREFPNAWAAANFDHAKAVRRIDDLQAFLAEKQT